MFAKQLSHFHLFTKQLSCFRCLQYTFEELLDHVQASENEVWEALEKLQSCVIDGKPVLNQVGTS